MTNETWPTEQQKPEIDKTEIEKPEPEIYKEARTQIEQYINTSQDNHEAIMKISDSLESFFKQIDRELLSDEQIEEIRNSLLNCEKISDPKELANELTDIIKPLLDIKQNEQKKFEEIQARVMNETNGFKEINRLLSYGKDNDVIHIHAPAGKLVDNKFSLYRQGMRDLAKIISEDPEIKIITATSYLVAEHPGLFTLMGFEVRELSEEEKKEHFADYPGKICKAEISREEFLKKFLKEK